MDYLEEPPVNIASSSAWNRMHGVVKLLFQKHLAQIQAMQLQLTLTTWIVALCAQYFLWYKSNWLKFEIHNRPPASLTTGTREEPESKPSVSTSHVVSIPNISLSEASSCHQASTANISVLKFTDGIKRTRFLKNSSPCLLNVNILEEFIKRSSEIESQALHANHSNERETISANYKLLEARAFSDQNYPSVGIKVKEQPPLRSVRRRIPEIQFQEPNEHIP